jgi:starch-binding outer membrane protein, SusD/RagB family
MKTYMHRARMGVSGALATIALLVPGCASFKDDLLEPQNPGLIDETAVESPAAAAALKVGAMGRLKVLVSGSETLWQEGGHLADEYANSDFQNSRNDVDARTMSPDNTLSNYTSITQARGYIRDAIAAEQHFEPHKVTDIGELYMALAFIEMNLAEGFCNGIPLGSNKKGVVDYGGPEFKPLTTAEVFDVALSHIDSALAIIPSTGDAAAQFVRQAALIVKARILVNKGQFAAAAALVPVGTVATTYQYLWTSSTALNSDDLGIWTLNNSVARVTVSDSAVTYQGRTFTTLNAVPFVSLNDPRVPVVSGASLRVAAEDGLTPLYIQQIWKNRDDPIAMVAGIDARMIEAEAKLFANDIAGAMTILNAVRATPPRLGILQPTALPALPTPATKDAAISLFFREKAFWTFSRGQRLGDLRRLIRQYGRTQDKVFPSGQHYKGGTYGTDVNFPVPDGEKVNPQFKGCIDRNA